MDLSEADKKMAVVSEMKKKNTNMLDKMIVDGKIKNENA